MPSEIEAIKVVKTGITIATGAASANSAMPTNSSNLLPNYVRVSCTAACYVKIGVSGVTAAAGDLLLLPSDSCILKVNGETFIAGIQQAAAGVLNAVALEDL